MAFALFDLFLWEYTCFNIEKEPAENLVGMHSMSQVQHVIVMRVYMYIHLYDLN